MNKDLKEDDKEKRKSALITILNNNNIDTNLHEEWLNYQEDSLTFSEFREERIK